MLKGETGVKYEQREKHKKEGGKIERERGRDLDNKIGFSRETLTRAREGRCSTRMLTPRSARAAASETCSPPCSSKIHSQGLVRRCLQQLDREQGTVEERGTTSPFVSER